MHGSISKPGSDRSPGSAVGPGGGRQSWHRCPAQGAWAGQSRDTDAIVLGYEPRPSPSASQCSRPRGLRGNDPLVSARPAPSGGICTGTGAPACVIPPGHPGHFAAGATKTSRWWRLCFSPNVSGHPVRLSTYITPCKSGLFLATMCAVL